MQTGEKIHKFRNMLAFAAATILVIVGGFYLTQPFLPSVSNEILPLIPDKFTSKIMTPYWADKRFSKADPKKEKIMLSKGESKIIENIKIVYQGSPSRSHFKLDVFVLDFDSEMPFSHTLDMGQAKKGFRLAGNDFQLISARKHRIQLWRHKKSLFGQPQ